MLKLLVEELYVEDALEELIGMRLCDVPKRKYAQIVAVALVLRHSWKADDLAYVVKRLEIA